MLGPYAYDLRALPLLGFLLYMVCSFNFYLYDLSLFIYPYLSCLSYVSYYNGSKVFVQTVIKPTVVSEKKFWVITPKMISLC